MYMATSNVPMQDSDNPYDNGYKSPYDKKKNWKQIDKIGWRCTCQVFWIAIPPEGINIPCEVHGNVHIKGSEVTWN